MIITKNSELHVHVITGKCVMILNLCEFDTLSVPPTCDLLLFLSIKDQFSITNNLFSRRFKT